MSWTHPDHVDARCEPCAWKGVVSGRDDSYRVDTSFLQVSCDCGSSQFSVAVSDFPSAKAICAQCRRESLLYDIRVYPAATPNPGTTGEYHLWQAQDDPGPFTLAVSYEYSEDAESADDISWFVLLAKGERGSTLYEVLNDETA